jgi:hypothetical protein
VFAISLKIGAENVSGAWWVDKHREYIGRITIPIEGLTTF